MKGNGPSLIEYMIAVLIALIMILIVAYPIITGLQDSFDDTKEFENGLGESHYRLSQFDTENSYTIAYSTAGTITINSVDYNLANEEDVYNIVFMTESLQIRLSPTGVMTVTTTLGEKFNGSVSSFSMVVSAGMMTFSINDLDAIQGTYTTGFIYDAKGEYVNNNTGYYNTDTQISGFRYSSGGYYVYFLGTSYKDGAISDNPFTVISSEVEDTDGQVMKLTNIRYNASQSLNAIIVPYTVKSVTNDADALMTIIGILPIIMILGLLIAIASVIIHSKNGFKRF